MISKEFRLQAGEAEALVGQDGSARPQSSALESALLGTTGMVLLGALVFLVGAFFWVRRRTDAPMKPTRPASRATGAKAEHVPVPVVESSSDWSAATTDTFMPEQVALDAAPMPDALAGFRLAAEADLAQERRTELLVSLGSITMPPRSLHELMSAEFLSNVATRELADLIMREPLLTAKLLGRVNSSFYGLRSPIVSVPHAITYLGMNAVRDVVLQFTLRQVFASENRRLKQLHEMIFEAGTIASEMCALLAQRLGLGETGGLSTQTVLSFLGDFAVARLLPPGPAAENWPMGMLERSRAEEAALGTNAAVIGGLLMREWGLPLAIRDGAYKVARVLDTPAGSGDVMEESRLALSYGCARIGEAIAMRQVGEAADVNFTGQGRAEYYHLQGYLQLAPLARIPALLRAPEIRVVMERMIASVGKPARR